MADHKFRPLSEVLPASDGPRRRHWSDADKLRIVEESFLGPRRVSATARRNGVGRSLLTIWRRQYQNGELGVARPPAFIPLMLGAEEPAGTPAPRSARASADSTAKIEIVLANGRRLTVPVAIDPAVLAGLLPVLDGA